MDKINFQNNKLPALNATNLNQLQENVDKAKYEKSGGLIDGECIVADISSKNKFNINTTYDKIGSSTTYLIDGSKITVTGKWFIGCLINVKPNTNYYCSFNRLSTVGLIRIMDEDETAALAQGTTDFSFNTGNNTKVRMYIYANPAGTNSQTAIFENIQIEEGTVATDYYEYINFDNTYNIVTGKEIATNEYVDGKQVYRKRINFGALPNNTTKRVAHNLTSVTFVRFSVSCTNASGYCINLPYVDLGASVCTVPTITNTEIVIKSVTDQTTYNAYVDLYYTKN